MFFEKNLVLGDLLGFNPLYYTKANLCQAENIVRIIKVNSIKVECSIATGSYHNGQLVYTLQ